MVLNKLLEHDLQSPVLLSLSMVFQAVLLIQLFFLRRYSHGITILFLYDDNMIITGDDMQGIQDLKHFLSRQFEMKDLGPLNYYLDLEVSSFADGYYFTQAKYTFDMFSQGGIIDSKIVTHLLGITVALILMMANHYLMLLSTNSLLGV